jgi:hypothetical protein
MNPAWESLKNLEYILPEDGDKIQSPKHFILKNKQDSVLDEDRMMENVQKHDI